ncbi:MAG: hypothetical protein JSU86_02865 [Phycisphaerales bacterium]|nr:MAG: hypothetical protein JSU86_02865 [Phycisphaerales bacterium]
MEQRCVLNVVAPGNWTMSGPLEGTAYGALQAFGPDYAADSQLCLEQQDFARRLIASLGP